MSELMEPAPSAPGKMETYNDVEQHVEMLRAYMARLRRWSYEQEMTVQNQLRFCSEWMWQYNEDHGETK